MICARDMRIIQGLLRVWFGMNIIHTCELGEDNRFIHFGAEILYIFLQYTSFFCCYWFLLLCSKSMMLSHYLFFSFSFYNAPTSDSKSKYRTETCMCKNRLLYISTISLSRALFNSVVLKWFGLKAQILHWISNSNPTLPK